MIMTGASHPPMGSPYEVTDFFFLNWFPPAAEIGIPGDKGSEGNLALAWYFRNKSLSSIEEYYKKKFSDTVKGSYIQECTSAVMSKYSKIENLVMDKVFFTEERLTRFIKSLKSGCTGVHDGILSEHLKWGVESPEFVHHIGTLVTVCLRYGVVPESFRKGTLIPVLKKTTSDPTVSSNYRPIVLSTTSKLLKMYIVEECAYHDFEDTQVGFVQGRGTNMAISLM